MSSDFQAPQAEPTTTDESVRCPVCATKLSIRDRHCASCGTRLVVPGRRKQSDVAGPMPHKRPHRKRAWHRRVLRFRIAGVPFGLVLGIALLAIVSGIFIAVSCSVQRD